MFRGRNMPLPLTLEEERTPLLGPTSACGPSSKTLSETKVYPLIHLIRVDILTHIDTPLTYDQLIAPDCTYTIIRPLTEKYLALQNQATVFCLLLNKVQFARDSQQLSISTLSQSRATLCEILAIRVLRGWSERSLPLATVLLTPWAVFQGASEEIIERAKEEGDDDVLTDGGTALEMAIVSSSKRFIRSPSCQKVIEGIWNGRIIYSGVNAHALIADNYKKKPIQMYNPHKAPLLDHYRLKVPKIRSFLEYANFVILFVLYVVAVEGIEEDHLNKREILFVIYALAYSLDKLATIREHGLKVFSSSLVNGFDLVFMIIYFVYLTARMYGFHYNNADAISLGADWLAIGAVLIFPRLAFITFANNLMVLSIRSMLTEFFFLMGIGIFCFLGFLYALFTLGQGRFELSTIGWWLLEVYFGLDASGFENAHDLHPFLGPIVIIVYALLSNTLLLTVLVAILGNTFATINADASAESMFRKAVSTLEGVKSDAVFSYQLPFNIVAVIVMWPMSYILSPRWFHKLNVVMIRASNLPVLLIIALYERRQYSDTSIMEDINDYAERYVGSLPRKLKAAAGFDNFGSRHDFDMIFEIEREIGTFYRDWEEDRLDEDFQLPPPFDEEDQNQDQSEDDEEEGQEVSVFSQTGKTTASPAGEMVEGDEDGQRTPRTRHNSMPLSSKPRSPTAPVFPHYHPAPFRVRRNSSIHEPSPLARLFVRDADDEKDRIERLRERRQSLIGLAMPSPRSQPGFANFAPPRNRSSGPIGAESQPLGPGPSPLRLAELRNKTKEAAPGLRRSAAPVDEGKKLTFVTPQRSPAPSRPQSPSTTRGRGSPSVPFPTRDPSSSGRSESASGKGTIGKASDIEARETDMVPRKDDDDVVASWAERLDGIEERQKRIEELLVRLAARA